MHTYNWRHLLHLARATIDPSLAVCRPGIGTEARPNRLNLIAALVLLLVPQLSYPAVAQSTFQLIHIFTAQERGPFGGPHPVSLILGSDNYLYGATVTGGVNDHGTLFRISRSGGDYTILLHFEASSTGSSPVSLLEGRDGKLYGSLHSNGPDGGGTLFSVQRDGTSLQILRSFGVLPGGLSPASRSLVQGSDGRLYGTTTQGLAGYFGASGSLFSIATDGTDFRILHVFDDYCFPTGLMQAQDGHLIGGAYPYPNYQESAIYRVSMDGSNYQVLHVFDAPGDGRELYAPLVQLRDGTLVGTTTQGGAFVHGGTLFRMDADGGNYTIIRSFGEPVFYAHDYAAVPWDSVVEGPDGMLYGMTAEGGSNSNGGTIFRISPSGTGYEVLHEFDVNTDYGFYPMSRLTHAGGGVFYGSTCSFWENPLGSLFELRPEIRNRAPLISWQTPPTLECSAPEGTPFSLAFDASDPEGDALTVAVNVDGGSTQNLTVPASAPDTTQRIAIDLALSKGIHSIRALVTDTHGAETLMTTSVVIEDTLSPQITILGSVSVMTECHASYEDAGATARDACEGDVSSSLIARSTLNTDMLGDYTITYQVSDRAGNATSATRDVRVVDTTPPAIGAIVAPVEPLSVGTPVQVSATFTDACGAHNATWAWGDQTISSADITDTATGSNAAGSHLYTSPGVYEVHLSIIDEAGNLSLATSDYVVIYDPSAGFVTGGGWIDSPPGAYPLNPEMVGKAVFAFVSKYSAGASLPSGQTQFVFKSAGLTFHSTSYDWLVVAGSKAKYKGTGAFNGRPGYGFMIAATDGNRLGGAASDCFRIKIWETATGTILYDNQLGATESAEPTTVVRAGNIAIHKD